MTDVVVKKEGICELWTQEPFLISTFWFLGFNLQFTALFPLYPLPPSQKNPWVEVEVGNS